MTTPTPSRDAGQHQWVRDDSDSVHCSVCGITAPCPNNDICQVPPPTDAQSEQVKRKYWCIDRNGDRKLPLMEWIDALAEGQQGDWFEGIGTLETIYSAKVANKIARELSVPLSSIDSAAATIERLESERDSLRTKLEAAEKVIEKAADFIASEYAYDNDAGVLIPDAEPRRIHEMLCNCLGRDFLSKQEGEAMVL